MRSPADARRAVPIVPQDHGSEIEFQYIGVAKDVAPEDVPKLPVSPKLVPEEVTNPLLDAVLTLVPDEICVPEVVVGLKELRLGNVVTLDVGSNVVKLGELMTPEVEMVLGELMVLKDEGMFRLPRWGWD